MFPGRRALVDGNYVWRVEGSRLYKRPVNVVWKDQQIAVVNSGLNDGDQVNITPLGYMISGSLIEIISSEEDKSSMLGAVPAVLETEAPNTSDELGVRG